MQCRPITERDKEVITKWHSIRGFGNPPKDAMPEYGFIVDNVAAGFLYRTDSSIALLDGYIASPESSQEERSEALDAITKDLLTESFEQGFKYIIVFTQIPSVQQRAESWGFLDRGTYQVYMLSME